MKVFAEFVLDKRCKGTDMDENKFVLNKCCRAKRNNANKFLEFLKLSTNEMYLKTLETAASVICYRRHRKSDISC